MDMADRARTRDEPGGGSFVRRLIPPGVAGCFVAAGLVLPAFMFQSEQRPDVPGLGPGAWPGIMLAALAFFSAIWLAVELWGLARGRPSTSLSAPPDENSYNFGKALTGLALIIAFGWLLPVLGFALATWLFLLVWFLFGGLRHPVVLAIVPAAGMVGLLWMFMGLALMPLSRGIGPFERFSVAFLQFIGIY